MRILILSNVPWSVENSFGNTFSNLFSGIENLEFANIFCRYGEPNNDLVSRYFQITEKSLLANLKNQQIPSGQEIFPEKKDTAQLGTTAKKGFDFARKARWQILFWARDFIWKIGRWKSAELKRFLDDFQPDLLYFPIYSSNYLCDIGLFIKQYLGVPMVGHVTDDVYTFKQIRFSPLYWIDRLGKRRKIKKLIRQCVYVDTFSDIQKQEYEKIFQVPFCVRLKNIGDCPPVEAMAQHQPKKIVFTGNLSSGRWKTLALLGKALAEINAKETKAQLLIYSATVLTKPMEKSLSFPGSVFFMGVVSAQEIVKIQQDADILLHAESFTKKGRFEVRMSFSTKIVDYLSRKRCILAVGPKDVASMDYLLKNDAAFVISEQSEILSALKQLVDDDLLIASYAQKAYACGVKNHNQADLARRMRLDLEKAVEG